MLFESGASSALLALPRATHATLHALSARLPDLRLTTSEVNAMANLADGISRSVGDLSEDTGIRTSTLTGVLDRLERRGYLSRELDFGDRRSIRLVLTASGRTVAARVRRAVTELEAAALANVPADHLAGYHAVVSALHRVC